MAVTRLQAMIDLRTPGPRESWLDTVIPLAFVLLPFAIYGVVVLLRRMRLRAAASALDASYDDRGWFRTGAIVAKDFEVHFVRAGKTLRTRVHVKAPDTPGHFLVATDFFDGPPDWQHAKSLQKHTQRVFFAAVNWHGYAGASEAEQKSLASWLARGASAASRLQALNEAGIRDIEIGDDAIATSFRGVVTNVARLQRTVAALRLLLPRTAAPSSAR